MYNNYTHNKKMSTTILNLYVDAPCRLRCSICVSLQHIRTYTE